MDFNKKVLDNITKKGALKAYNTKGVKLTFKSKVGGHEFSGNMKGMGKPALNGSAKGKASGDGTYKGQWMGFNVA